MAFRIVRLHILIIIFLECPFCGGMSFQGSGGHYSDIVAIFEGVKGDNFTDITKIISSGIDSGFPDEFYKVFGSRPRGNHRILGHWGFSGNIPFEKEPYKSALKDYPKDKIVKLWRNYVNQLTKEAMVKLGLPKAQAKAVVGIIYDIHLLGDIKPGNKVLAPLPSVQSVSDDLCKNLQRLYGKNSKQVQEIIKQIKNIKTRDPQKFAESVLKILKKHPLGKEFWARYGKCLKKKGIIYKPLKKLLAKCGIIKDGAVETVDSSKVGKGAKGAGLLLPNGKMLVAVKEGAMAGILVFAIDGGRALYSFNKNDILRPEFERKVNDAIISGGCVAAATAVTVILGASPVGIVIVAVGVGSYWVIDKTLHKWHEAHDRKFLTAEDIKVYGIEVDSILTIDGRDSSLNLL